MFCHSLSVLQEFLFFYFWPKYTVENENVFCQKKKQTNSKNYELKNVEKIRCLSIRTIWPKRPSASENFTPNQWKVLFFIILNFFQNITGVGRDVGQQLAHSFNKNVFFPNFYVCDFIFHKIKLVNYLNFLKTHDQSKPKCKTCTNL